MFISNIFTRLFLESSGSWVTEVAGLGEPLPVPHGAYTPVQPGILVDIWSRLSLGLFVVLKSASRRFGRKGLRSHVQLDPMFSIFSA